VYWCIGVLVHWWCAVLSSNSASSVKMHPQAKQFFPCPLRQQPDYDELVLFKPERILPCAYVSFQRRFKPARAWRMR